MKSRMRIVGTLSSIVLVALPFGLGGCGTTAPPSPTAGLPSLAPASPDTPSQSPNSSSPTPSVSSPPSSSNSTPKLQTESSVYWLSGDKNKLTLTAAPIVPAPTSKDPKTQLDAAFTRLLAGPSDKKTSTAIPTGTKLKLITIKNDGVHVDLSQTFMSGGGSASMQGRLGQVIYTASSLKETEPIWISVEGKPIQNLGGEGLEVTQPMTRAEFNKNFPL